MQPTFLLRRVALRATTPCKNLDQKVTDSAAFGGFVGEPLAHYVRSRMLNSQAHSDR